MNAPTCPRHGHDLQVVEEGDLNGTTVRYWAGCPGKPRQLIGSCPAHGVSAYAIRKREDWERLRKAGVDLPAPPCRCRPAVQCAYETRTEDAGHAELDLFGGAT